MFSVQQSMLPTERTRADQSEWAFMCLLLAQTRSLYYLQQIAVQTEQDNNKFLTLDNKSCKGDVVESTLVANKTIGIRSS